MTEDPGQVPAGTGSEPKTVDAEARLAALELELKTEREAREAAEKLTADKEKESRGHQSRADRLARINEKLLGDKPTAPTTGRRLPANSPMTAVAEAQAQAQGAAINAEIERQLRLTGLDEADLPEDWYPLTIEDVQTRIELISLRKGQESGPSDKPPDSVESALAATGGAPTPPSGEIEPTPEGGSVQVPSGSSGGLFDTGGPSGDAIQPRAAKIQRMHGEAEKLRTEARKGEIDSPKLKSAAYLKLRAIHNDPSKLVAGGEVPADDLDDVDI